MQVGVLPAYPRGIVASEALGVLLKPLIRTEALVALVISAAKMPIPDMVMRQSVMYPQTVMSCGSSVSRENWRGNSDGKNSYHAQRFH